MSHIDLTPSATGFQGVLRRLHIWWQQRHELGSLDRGELNRLAGELGFTASDLQNLVVQGPHGTALLRRRLEALGITRADVERISAALARDLERTCSCCDEKSACKRDLAQDPATTGWKDYCPNAISIEDVMRTKSRVAT